MRYSERIKYGQAVAGMFNYNQNIVTATVRTHYMLKPVLWDKKIETLVNSYIFNKVFYSIEMDRDFGSASYSNHLHLVGETAFNSSLKESMSKALGIRNSYITYLEPVKGVENIALYVCKEMNKYGDSHHNFFL